MTECTRITAWSASQLTVSRHSMFKDPMPAPPPCHPTEVARCVLQPLLVIVLVTNTAPPLDAMAKAGLNGLTMDLAGHLGPHGVRVNCIAPGGFASNCISPNGGINGSQHAGEGRSGPSPGFIRDFSKRVPLGHMGRDGVDLGGAVLFLAAPASDYVVGQTLVVDGGFSIWH